MPRKTPEEIAHEVGKLHQLKPTVRRFSVFNDDNHAAIDAAISVLTERLDDDEIEKRFGPDAAADAGGFQQVLDTARRAHDWMVGRVVATEPPVSEEGWPLAVAA